MSHSFNFNSHNLQLSGNLNPGYTQRGSPGCARKPLQSSMFSVMKMQCIRVLRFLFLISCLSVIQTAPIRTTFEECVPGHADGVNVQCCPSKPWGPIVDFVPVFNSSKPLRVRRALQCLDEVELPVYRQKLEKAYELMRALPDDDPRSLYQQNRIHCAYSSGSFGNGGEDGIDIHYSWLFQPYHRLFLYFHERILQSLLDDPTFTLHFWNWDNDGAPAPGRPGCLKAGNTFPAMFADPASSLYHPGRSVRAKDPSVIVNLQIDESVAGDFSKMDPQPKDAVLGLNSNEMHEAMMGANSTRVFMGRSYRAGDSRVIDPADGVGQLENMGHGSLHDWIGGDMFLPILAAVDPIFYVHHNNVERLWDLWHRLGPGGEDPDDPDFLDVEFLFFDENVVLNRVKIRDCLDTRALGYYFEETNDVSWNYPYVSEKTKSDDILDGLSVKTVASKLAQN